MVRKSYQTIDETYISIKQSACGRQACTVLILVAYEVMDVLCFIEKCPNSILPKVDAMATCKMLTHQLRFDNVSYAICPVLNKKEIEVAFERNVTSDTKTVFLINCGAVCILHMCCIFFLHEEFFNPGV